MIEISQGAVVTALSLLFGGGGVVALLRWALDRSRGKREDALKKEQTAFAQLESVVGTLREEVDRLNDQRAADLVERERDRGRLDQLEEQNRLYRWVLSEVLKRVHRIPEQISASDLTEFILSHIPSLGGNR